MQSRRDLVFLQCLIDRVLDVIARAGGPGNQGYDMWVSLERRGHRATIPFGALLYEPANNIYVIPNDVIYLYNLPQTFVAFGAGLTWANAVVRM